MISRQFIFIVLIANVVALPLVWLLCENWLSGFASRIGLSSMFFLISVGVSVLIAILTIATQSIKAAYKNPAVVIREN